MRWRARAVRWGAWAAGILVILVVLAVIAAFFIDEPLRRYTEAQMNRRLDGYTVRIGKLDFHPVGFSIDFGDLVVIQNAHPDPPIARISQLTASVEWRALLHRRLVADFSVVKPILYVNLAHVRREAEDEVPVTKRGWQEALEAMYPLKIDHFAVRDGELTYVDQDQSKPLRVTKINARTANIRNVRSKDRVYPSDLRVEAVVFDHGQLLVDGRADFMAIPHPGVLALVKLDQIELDYFKPILARYNFQLRRGQLTAQGDFEYAPKLKAVHLERVVVRNLDGDYVHTPGAARSEKQAARAVSDTAQEVANKPEMQFRVDHLQVVGSNVGLVNRAVTPPYRVFISDLQLELRNLSNHFTDGPAVATLQGKFLGNGPMTANATFLSDLDGPDFDLAVRVEDTQMTSMNDLLRAYGKFDVVGGLFSLYAELKVKNRQVAGYVKPLFRNLDVYDKRQDQEKSVFRKLYEGVVGGVAKLLENQPREEVATKTPIAGTIDNPQPSTWEAIVRLIQNAFFQAILPGFDREVRRAARR